MKTIWKYPLEIADIQAVEMPEEFKVLTVQMQGKRPCVWVEVLPEAPKIKVFFAMYGTGHTMSLNPNRKYVGTFQLEASGLVFHLYIEGTN